VRALSGEGLARPGGTVSRARRARADPPATVERIIALRASGSAAKKNSSPGEGLSRATVSRHLRAAGSAGEGPGPTAPVVRYEREHAARAIHLELKKSALSSGGPPGTKDVRPGRSRGAAGVVHVGIDDARAWLHARIRTDEKEESAVAFLMAAVAYYASPAFTVSRGD